MAERARQSKDHSLGKSVKGRALSVGLVGLLGLGGAAATSLSSHSEAFAKTPKRPHGSINPKEQKFSPEEETQIRAVSESIFASLQITPDDLATWGDQTHPDGTDNRISIRLSGDVEVLDWWAFPWIKVTSDLSQYGTELRPDVPLSPPLTPDLIEKIIALGVERGLSREEATRRVDERIADEANKVGANVYKLRSGTYVLPRRPNLFVDHWDIPAREIGVLGIDNGRVTHSLTKEAGGQSSVLFTTSILPDGTKLVSGGTYNFAAPHNPLIGDRQQNFTTVPVFYTYSGKNNLDPSTELSIPFPSVDELNSLIERNRGVPIESYYRPSLVNLPHYSKDRAFLRNDLDASIRGVETFPSATYKPWEEILDAFLHQDMASLQQVVNDSAQHGGPFIPTIKYMEINGERIGTPVTQDDIEHSVRRILSSQTRLKNMFEHAPLVLLTVLPEAQSLLDCC
jgi:hypothetical protein